MKVKRRLAVPDVSIIILIPADQLFFFFFFFLQKFLGNFLEPFLKMPDFACGFRLCNSL